VACSQTRRFQLLNFYTIDQVKAHAELVGNIFSLHKIFFIRVVGGLSKKYKTPKEAKAEYCGQESMPVSDHNSIVSDQDNKHLLICLVIYLKVVICKHCQGFTLHILIMVCKFQMISCAMQQMQCYS